MTLANSLTHIIRIRHFAIALVSVMIREEISIAYSTCSANIAFEFHGKGYCSLEPLNCTRRPSAAIDEMIKINREIYKLNSIKGSYIGFQLGCNDEGILMGLVKFKIPTGEINCYNIF